MPELTWCVLWQMHGYAAEVMRVLGLQEVKVSISHADEVAVAQVSPANPPPPLSPSALLLLHFVQ